MTPHPQAPLAQASDTAPLVLDQPHGAIDLTRALDAAGQRAHTALAAETVSDPAKLRQAAVTELRKVLAEGRDLIARELGAAPFEARRITRAYAHLTDIVVRIAFALARDKLHPNPLPTDAERLSLLAVGGYGRNEMAPFSDVDLLFLTPYKLTGWAESVIESTLYMLWDLKLKVGHSSRTIRDCMKLGREDITIRTSLLEMRVIDGDLATAQELQDTLRTQLFQQTTSQFTEAKLEERDKRHNRQGGQRYVVEPNVKEGKGGLRDLQTLYWIAKYIHSVDNAADLVALKVFRQEEFDAFDQAETYLWAVRCHLHLIAGRAQDQLTFDLQVEAPENFFADKLNMLRLYAEAIRTGYLLHPDAMREISARLDIIDDEMRAAPEANKLFLDIMLKYGNPERPLRRMNELGVLAAFIPEFAPIVEHTIQVISTLDRIERKELIEELPVASRILEQGVNRRVLFVACLIHDLGKGRPEDHSVLGAQIARRLCPRLGLKPAECDTVEWLVRYHLLMSDTAQKRDISDPRTIRDFARAVTSRDRLELLTVLTVCDIRGVGPGVWNNWKATLLRQLYFATASALEHGLEDVTREKAQSEAKAMLRQALADWPKADIRREVSRHYGPYWQGLDTSTHTMFAHMLRDLEADTLKIDAQPDPDRDATRIGFGLVDHPGIFSRLAGAISLVGANVVDARSYTTSDGLLTAAFWVQDANGNPFEEARLPRLKSMIEKTLKGEVIASRALQDREKIKKRERPFDVPTTITFDNDGSDIYTIIEVDTRDRPGLLYDLTKTLAAANIQIASAQIATYGAQVVDTFYVKDVFGLKLHAKARQQNLERKLRDAIARVAERAGA